MGKDLLDRIRHEASKNGWSLTDVNRSAKLGERTIQAWDQYDPSLYSIQKVSEVLDVSIDYLLTGKNGKYVSDCESEKLLMRYIQECEFSMDSAFKIIGYMSRLKTYEDIPSVRPELLEELRKDKIIL